MKVLICLNHKLQPTQLADLEGHDVSFLQTVDYDLFQRLGQCTDNHVNLFTDARRLHWHAKGYDAIILPVGSPAFMAALVSVFHTTEGSDLRFIHCVYFSHSVRETIESDGTDGTVIKTNVFKHLRFFNLAGETLTKEEGHDIR